jgi:hypothetical protein
MFLTSKFAAASTQQNRLIVMEPMGQCHLTRSTRLANAQTKTPPFSGSKEAR